MAQKQGKNDSSALDSASKSTLALQEEAMLSFWKKYKIFEQTLEKESPKGEFVFYEGPPTANGRPGLHHLLSRAFKDVILRYKTMQGFHVRRRAGWDTHGLPVELEVEKTLGLSSKKDIEHYGIAEFNEQCKQNVWKYIHEWEHFTDRIGYWLDQDNPYITYKPEYIESVWAVIKKVFERDLLYKDYKVVPWCPRCGTGLSSHELAQGYKDVKDLSVYAKFKVVGEENTYFLAWTTTPWTLPGNIALAVGGDIEYVEIKHSDTRVNAHEKKAGEKVATSTFKTENLILAKKLLSIVEGEYEVVRDVKGSELVGLKYEPLYPFVKEQYKGSELEKAFTVYEADFVTTSDGTGIVHTAVMYGQDDFELGTKIGLPKHHLVGEDGRFLKGTGMFEGRFVKEPELEVDIIKDLHARNLLFKKEKYEHSYPFCWRCKTPLIYYARDSWYIRMSDIRDELVSENEKINWEPSHIKSGRFGEWIREVKDWAISRERYWGTPLPIWEAEDGSGYMTVGSLKELKEYLPKSTNTYIVLRHGEAEHNALSICNSDINTPYPLTEQGKEQVREIAGKLKNRTISTIYTSPFLRTKETANMISDELVLDKERVIEDSRIAEYNFGIFDKKPFSEYQEYAKNNMQTYDTPIEGGESYLDAKKRFGDFLYDIDSKHANETIVIVTHGIGVEVLEAILEGADMERSKEIIDTLSPPPGYMKEFELPRTPRNENYELDFHRPYIDDVILERGGKKYRRVKEVMDVWFDSGAMPFAQDHYPMENQDWVEGVGYPADYITEAIDQTRGWFYTLHAIGVLVGKGHAYKNVICLGHILDKDGKKMSKSVGNVINPWEAMDMYGADALRVWMYTINQPGESKNFDPRSVDEVVKKVFNLLLNTHAFYELHASKHEHTEEISPHVLDQWILVYLDDVAEKMTTLLDGYKVLEAMRLLRESIADISQWYVRRSRDRFKADDEDNKDARHALSTLRAVLMRTSALLAPFAPFTAEYVFQKIRKNSDPASVHLLPWPGEFQSSDEIFLTHMQEVRTTASIGLEARARAGIKVRQPLASITLATESLKGHEDYLAILKDELNVKEIFFDTKIKEAAILDTNITPELKAEGNARDFMRFVQEYRKEKGLNPDDQVRMIWRGDEAVRGMVEMYREMFQKTLSVSQFEEAGADQDLGKSVTIDDMSLDFDFK